MDSYPLLIRQQIKDASELFPRPVINPGEKDGFVPSTYTLYIDSENRDKNIYPDAADFVMDSKVHRTNLLATAIHLVSFEMTAGQQTVEEDWSTLYYDEGIRFLADLASGDDSSRTLTISRIEGDGSDPSPQNNHNFGRFPSFGLDSRLALRDSASRFSNSFLPSSQILPSRIQVSVQVPLWLNPIDDIQISGSNSIIVTTRFPHALNALVIAMWAQDWNSPISIIDTSMLDPASTQLVTSSAFVLDNFNFQMNNVTSGDMARLLATIAALGSANLTGYLNAPLIPGPVQLAKLLNKLEFQNGITIEFDSHKNTFRANPSHSPRFNSENHGGHLIPVMIGIGRAFFNGVDNPGQFAGIKAISIRPGNYDPPSFLNAITNALNGLFAIPSGGTTFAFSDPYGQIYSFTIPSGTWSAVGLAQYVQTQMNAAIFPVNPLLTYTVTYNPTNSKFTFSSDQGQIFGLEFGNTSANLSFVPFGFLSFPKRGQVSYTSDETVQDPHPRWQYYSQLDGAMNKFVFAPTNPLPLSVTLTTQATVPITVLLQTVLPNVAHGLLAEDVIGVRITPNGPRYLVRVQSVPSANSAILDVGSALPFLSPLVNQPATFAFEGFPRLGFHFGNTPRMGTLLGFQENTSADTPADGSSNELTSRKNFNLHHPSYLLLELVDPPGSQNAQHERNGQVIHSVLAKIIFGADLRIDKGSQTDLNYSTPTALDRMHFRISNPWQQKYHTHGNEWSASFMFIRTISGNVFPELG
jgi:hypothetical protein